MKRLNLTENDRSLGLIVTGREQRTDEQLVVHRAGPPGQVLPELVAFFESLGPDWKIATISSPHSIYRDLQGTRVALDAQGKGHTRGSVPRDRVGDPRSTERSALAQIGKLDMLEPLRHTYALKGQVSCSIADVNFME